MNSHITYEPIVSLMAGILILGIVRGITEELRKFVIDKRHPGLCVGPGQTAGQAIQKPFQPCFTFLQAGFRHDSLLHFIPERKLTARLVFDSHIAGKHAIAFLWKKKRQKGSGDMDGGC